jgi:hypothetical protein
MTKFFVDISGNYIGGFDGAEPPVGAIEVPTPPEHASQKWEEDAWEPYTPPPAPKPPEARLNKLEAALKAKGYITDEDIV